MQNSHDIATDRVTSTRRDYVSIGLKQAAVALPSSIVVLLVLAIALGNPRGILGGFPHAPFWMVVLPVIEVLMAALICRVQVMSGAKDLVVEESSIRITRWDGKESRTPRRAILRPVMFRFGGAVLRFRDLKGSLRLQNLTRRQAAAVTGLPEYEMLDEYSQKFDWRFSSRRNP
jgi:hypothetical protein